MTPPLRFRRRQATAGCPHSCVRVLTLYSTMLRTARLSVLLTCASLPFSLSHLLPRSHIGCRAIDCQPAAAPGLVDHIKPRIKLDVGSLSFSLSLFLSFVLYLFFSPSDSPMCDLRTERELCEKEKHLLLSIIAPSRRESPVKSFPRVCSVSERRLLLWKLLQLRS